MIDHSRTMKYNQRNKEIEKFSKSYISADQNSYTSLCLLSNILNVVHVSIAQVFIVSLSHSPRILLTLLMTTEVLFWLLTLIPYCFQHKFISVVELLHKCSKSMCLGGFFVVCIKITFSSDPRVNHPVDESFQSTGIAFLTFGIASTYIFTLIKIIQMVIAAVAKRLAKRGKKESDKLEDVEDLTKSQRGLIFYKEEKENSMEFFERENSLSRPEGGEGQGMGRKMTKKTPKKNLRIKKNLRKMRRNSDKLKLKRKNQQKLVGQERSRSKNKLLELGPQAEKSPVLGPEARFEKEVRITNNTGMESHEDLRVKVEFTSSHGFEENRIKERLAPSPKKLLRRVAPKNKRRRKSKKQKNINIS